MFTVRFGHDRGHAERGWLDSWHSFSFGEFHDPEHMGFRGLRVINEDRVQPAKQFGTHSHRDMEIVSYVLEGELEHRDSMGNGAVMVPGDVQRMSAGRGVTHSEGNPSHVNIVHFLQIWLLPSAKGISPSYEQKTFSRAQKQANLCLIASPDGRDGSVTLHADARMYAGCFDHGESAVYRPAPDRHTYLFVARGVVLINGRELRAGDGGSQSGPDELTIVGESQSEVLVFDLA
ncbi:MAG: pirin family protein [Deltaproteobacteria bacterium]|nr:pirin family protein [Deltaproteobacteria bacterium]